jgi:hypothetical protein
MTCSLGSAPDFPSRGRDFFGKKSLMKLPVAVSKPREGKIRRGSFTLQFVSEWNQNRIVDRNHRSGYHVPVPSRDRTFHNPGDSIEKIPHIVLLLLRTRLRHFRADARFTRLHSARRRRSADSDTHPRRNSFGQINRRCKSSSMNSCPKPIPRGVSA